MLYKRKITNKKQIMNSNIRIGIIGGAGYTGGELIRILLNHPNAQLIFVHSKSNAGNPLHQVHQDLLGETEMKFSDIVSEDIDLLFLCLGHGESSDFLKQNKITDRIKIIDLANDFRIKEHNKSGNREFIYGLPELNREKIRTTNAIANPGCFATAIELGLLPLASKGLINEVYTTGITGSTGAGQSLSQTGHFSWRVNNIQAYKTLTHQHLAEIHQTLNQLQPDHGVNVNFVPWRGDFSRGIFVSSTIKCNLDIDELNDLYSTHYNDHPFTIFSNNPIFLKQAIGTNKCFINIEKTNDTIVIHSVIDNLLKGASGQAVQNMNLLFGLNESAGLHLKSIAF
jgi:N-acetyl-gamma-glutamyl-phosphate reductase